MMTVMMMMMMMMMTVPTMMMPAFIKADNNVDSFFVIFLLPRKLWFCHNLLACISHTRIN